MLARYAALSGDILARAAPGLALADAARPYFERPYRS